MSVVGFDFGNESCVVAVARHRGIDVVLSDESKRETPAIVSFGEKQCFVGTAGAASALINPKNTISQIKRLIGRPFSDPELQNDIKLVPFMVTEGPDGFPLIHARYLGETKTFTPTQVLGMLLSNLKGIAEKNLNAAVVDCCIGIPVFFTDLQRRAILDAATIAGLHPLRLIHETTATALLYAIYKTDLPENDHVNVVFVDVGHASLQVCITALKKGQLKILAHSFDRSLGGRDFDEVLFQHFATKFKDEYKIDVHQNARACLRLRTACEKLKKVLSTNPEAPLNIECLMEEKDVRGFIKRDEFELISIPILERVKKPLEKALAEAGLTTEEIHTVEVVGSGSRVPAVIRILTEFFGKEPRRTLSASECLAKGCALECANRSPAFRVKDFQVTDIFPFPISMSWEGLAAVDQNRATKGQYNIILFPKGNPIPSLKAVTVLSFVPSSTLTFSLHYADASALQALAQISTYKVGPIKSVSGDFAKLKVRVRLNLHGIVSVESATLLEAEKRFSVPVVKEASEMDTDVSNQGLPPETVVTMQNANSEAPTTENDMPESSETSAHETEAKSVQMDKDVKENNNVTQLETDEMLMEEKRTMGAILSKLKLKNEKMRVSLLEKEDTVKELEKQCMDLKLEASKRDEMLMEEKRTIEAILSELKLKNEQMEVLLLEKDDTVKELEKQCMDLKLEASKRDEMLTEEKRTIESIILELKLKNGLMEVSLLEKEDTVKELEKQCMDLKLEASKRDEMLMEEKRTIEAILSELKLKNEQMEVLLLEKDDTVKELEKQCMDLKLESSKRDEILMEEKRTTEAILSEFKNKTEKMEVLLSEKEDTVKELEKQCTSLKFEASKRDETLMEEKRTFDTTLSELKFKNVKDVLLLEKDETVKELERQCMGLKYEAYKSAIGEKYCLIALVVSWLFFTAVMYNK